jgi:hypothetical protein
MTAPLLVSRVSSVDCAMPKSVSFTRPLGSTRILLGLTSRCTTPASCAACNAESSGSASRATLSCGSGPSRATRSARVGASTSSITM